MPNSNELMTAAEVAAMIPVHAETVRRWAREGQLTAVTLPSGRKRYRRCDVEALLTAGTAA